MPDIDRQLLETTRTRRERLGSALVFGGQDRRRPLVNNIRRFIGSIVLTAVICVGCLGFSFVMNILDTNNQEKALQSFRSAMASNPIQPGNGLEEVEDSPFLYDPKNDEYIDPQTGFVVDPKTDLATDPQGRIIDSRIDWYYDPETGYYTDPETGITIDPESMTIVEDSP